MKTGLLLRCCLLLVPVSARSNGNFTGCSVSNVVWGCKRFANIGHPNRNVKGACCAGFGGSNDGPKNIPENKCDRRCCDAEPGIMFWTLAPVADHFRYALRSANGNPAEDPKVYYPGKLQHIYIKTLRRDAKFRGLLMNALATEHSNKVVGTWEFPSGETNPLFWSSPRCPNSAIHRSAEEKAFTSLLRWRAPTNVDGKPVGKILFQALIKRGGANNGEFYTRELTLAQATVPVPATPTSTPSGASGAWTDLGPGCSANYQAATLTSADLGPNSGGDACRQKCERDSSCTHVSYGWAHVPKWCVTLSSFQGPLRTGATDCGSAGNTGVHTYQRPAPPPSSNPSTASPATNVSRTVTWKKSGSGQTCAEACADLNQVCWTEVLDAVRGPNAFSSITKTVVCGLPILANRDPKETALFVSSADRCFYPQTAPSGCNTARPGSTLLCPCGSEAGYSHVHVNGNSNAGKTQTISSCAGSGEDVTVNGAASTSAPNTFFGTMLLTLALAKHPGGRAVAAMASVMLWLNGADAHNWYISESRARLKAVGAKPCPPRVGGRFNVQVGPGQEFSAAWATGHGENATVLLVSAEHLHMIGSDAVRIARQYIDAAPTQQTEAKWRRQHGSDDNPAKSHESQKALTLVSKTDPLYHISPAQLRKNSDVHVYNIDPDRLKKDIRVSYKNAQMPHVYMAGFFVLTERNAFEFDQIRVVLPEWAAPGHYILMWDWQGYADCVDVELRTKAVEHPGGTGSGKHIFERVDHCQLAQPFQGMRGVCRQVAPSVEQCLNDIEDSESGVTFASSPYFRWNVMRIGVNVVPIMASGLSNPAFAAADGSTADAPWGTPWSLAQSRAGSCPGGHCRRDPEVCMIGGPLDLSGTDVKSWSGTWKQRWSGRKTTQPRVGCKVGSPTCPTEQDVMYFGGDIAQTTTDDVGGCCDACRANANCELWTYSTSGDKQCWLKQKARVQQTRRGETTFVSGSRPKAMSYTLFDAETSLDRAIQRCTGAECIGIALKDGKYSGCIETSADAASTFDAKTTAYQSKTNYLDTVKAATFTHKVTVSFQAPGAGAVLPAKTVPDTGGMYSFKNGDTYGWTGCAHTFFDTHQGNDQATVDNTYAWNTFVMCPNTQADTDTCQKAVVNGVALDPRRPNCKRNAWELSVPNGWYKVVAKVTRNHPNVFAPVGANHNACVIEGIRFPASIGDVKGPGHAYTLYVEVRDGRLTFEDVSRLHHEDYCDSISALEVYAHVGGNIRLDTWFPTSTDPYLERELPSSRKISIVSMLAPEDECLHTWLFKGGDANCLQSQATAGGWFADTGPIVGVSDTPCSDGGCLSGAKVCGRVSLARDAKHHVMKFRYEEQPDAGLQSRYWVDCEGKEGKYVFVMLPGSGRILTITDFKVNQEGPVGGDPKEFENKFACYTVHARKAEAQTPEYIVSTDPEDPVFYSSCYMREEELVYLPKEGSGVEKVDMDYEFNGQCLPCDLYAKNSKPKYLEPSIWRFADQCEVCSDADTKSC